MMIQKNSAQRLLIVTTLLVVGIDAQFKQNTCPNGTVEVGSGKNCPCVSVDSSCKVIDTRPEYATVRGKHCSKLQVTADADGNYPDVDVQLSWKMCNLNGFDIALNEKSKFFDWTRVQGSKKQNMANPRFPLEGVTLESGTCLLEEKNLTINTSNRYNTATQLEGFVLDSKGIPKNPIKDYCYAYSMDTINIKRGLCSMSTEVACKVTGAQTSCQDFIDMASKRDLCLQFDATLSWEVCNNEDYDMKIFQDSSSAKFIRKVHGRSKTNVVGNVQDLSANECKHFSAEVRNMNSCSREKLHFSVNVQGSRPNGKYWFECQDYSFQSLKFSTVCSEFTKEGLDTDVEKITSGRVTPLPSNCVRDTDGGISIGYKVEGEFFPGVRYSGAATFSDNKVLLVDDMIIRVEEPEWEVCSSLIDNACAKIMERIGS